jgi:hypothetical protein
MKLQQVEMIGLQPLQRLLQLSLRGRGIAAIDLRHQEGFIAVAIAQRLAHAEFAVPVTVIPRIIHEVDAAIDRGPDYPHRFAIGLGPSQVPTADSNERHVLAGAA